MFAVPQACSRVVDYTTPGPECSGAPARGEGNTGYTVRRMKPILAFALLIAGLAGGPGTAPAQEVEIPLQVQGEPTASDTAQAGILLFDGELYLSEDDLPNAVNAFRGALAVVPDHPRARLLLARTLTMALMRNLVSPAEQAGIGAEAMGHFRWVLDHDPGNSEATEAVRLLARRLVEDDSPDFQSDGAALMWQAGLRGMDEGRYGDAVEAFRRVVRAEPRANGVHRRLADALRLAGNQDAARVTYLKALELNPDDYLAMSGIALVLDESGKRTEALTRVRAAYNLNSETDAVAEAVLTVVGDPEKHELSDEDRALRGRALVTLGRWEEGEAALTPVAPQGTFLDRKALAKAVYFQGKLSKALDLYRDLHAESPNDLEPLFYLGAGNIQAGNRDAGRLYLRRVMERDPGNANAMKVLGLSLTEEPGQEEEALALLTAVRDSAPEDADRLTCAIGSLLLRLGRDEEARPELEACAKADTGNAAAQLGLGVLADRNGRKGEAIVHLEQYLNMEPAQPGVLIRLGLAYLQTGRDAEGYECLRRITKLEDAFAPPEGQEATDKDLLEMASFYLATVRAFDDAIFVGERLVALDPKNSIYNNNLAMVYADADTNQDRAYTLATEANRLEPDNPGHIDTLGWTLLRLERYNEAEKAFLRAIDLAGKAPEPQNLSEIYYHLGVLCQRTDRPGEAQTWLQKALEDPPTPFLQQEIEEAMSR